jgi:hypothetical protein
MRKVRDADFQVDSTESPSHSLYAKSSCRDICSIPIQANTTGEEKGISFDLNNTVVKIAKAFNARRNTHFM